MAPPARLKQSWPGEGVRCPESAAFRQTALTDELQAASLSDNG